MSRGLPRAPRSPIVAMLARVGWVVAWTACVAVVGTAVACGRYGPPVRPEPMPPSTAGAAESAGMAESEEPAATATEEAVTSGDGEPDRETDSVGDAVGDAERGSAAADRAPGPVDKDPGESSR